MPRSAFEVIIKVVNIYLPAAMPEVDRPGARARSVVTTAFCQQKSQSGALQNPQASASVLAAKFRS
ncbi:MAG: hypothetical protein ACRC62_28320 [Microcoleus sp.]